ncbi:hypothetical protein GCM10009555_018170 [Acrocarpospora macrocephala]|uniref:Uncharacterized protein n=1 Tax=Acrocarpospora macrocephala TaxID=150177 RepID=A0A5M3WEI1_9ACTN|nr:hypothetical protein [Acrocarpospora macrocephala]GES07477.1 hypothetical protein Amac_010720 [Acrocarpospora macrocephala]
MTSRPSPNELYEQAGGDPDRYRALMIEHGHLIPGKSEPLPCGWTPRAAAPELTPADEIRAAADLLRATIPGQPADVVARVVQSDSENMDAVAFCDQPAHEPYDTCDHCHTVEVHSVQLAALIAALFNAREPIARLLEIHTEICHGDGCATVNVARALNGGDRD